MENSMSLNYGEIIYKTKDVEILLANLIENNQQVCVKRYKNSSPQMFSALENELNFLYSLRHKNILTIFGHKFYEDNSVELILEYCSRRDLCDEINRRLKEGKPWSTRQLLKIIEDLINAFEFLQTQKIAHRDVKPDNILVTEDGTCKVSDMGNSKRVHGLNSKTIVGTAYYMSPELRCTQSTGSFNHYSMNEKDAFKSDVWSLGLTFLVLVSSKSVEDFSNLSLIESTLKNRLGELGNPFFKAIIEQMLVREIEYRPDFISLKQNTDQIIQKARTCVLCNRYSEDVCWCQHCLYAFHVECSKQFDFMCKFCGWDNSNILLDCYSCEGKINVKQIKACNHTYCQDCIYKISCSYCLEVPLYEANFSQINHFEYPESWCRDCYSKRELLGDRLKCFKCTTSICSTCKDYPHEKACSQNTKKYQVLCRCQMLRLKDPGSLFIECPICKYICVVCFKSTRYSHLSCIQLFNKPNIEN